MGTSQQAPKIVIQGFGDSSEQAVTQALEDIGIDPRIIQAEK